MATPNYNPDSYREQTPSERVIRADTNPVIETHPFKPFIPKGAKYLIIGSFPGKGQTEKIISETVWFYGAKRNTFWKIMEEVYDTELKTTSAKQKLFSDLKMGIADIILKAVRTADTNSDDNLQVIEYNEKAIKKVTQRTRRKTQSNAKSFANLSDP